MDSANSGSLQYSSGDDDFDSPSDHHSSFFFPSSSTAPTPPTDLPPPPPSSISHHLVDSSYLESSSLLRLDPTAAHTRRSSLGSVRHSTNCNAAYASFTSSPATSSPTGPSLRSPLTSAAFTTREPTMRALKQPSAVASTMPRPRSSRKRSRASRRAPTTVLTTDTSNFRTMVQEFTGIPSPPFAVASPGNPSSSSHFGRPRFDFFRSPASTSTDFDCLDLPVPPPLTYLLQPLADQKVQSPSFASNSSVLNQISSSSPDCNSASANSTKIGNVDSSTRIAATDIDFNPTNASSYQSQSLVSFHDPILGLQPSFRPPQTRSRAIGSYSANAVFELER